jgi:hypothetical protein
MPREQWLRVLIPLHVPSATAVLTDVNSICVLNFIFTFIGHLYVFLREGVSESIAHFLSGSLFVKRPVVFHGNCD